MLFFSSKSVPLLSIMFVVIVGKPEKRRKNAWIYQNSWTELPYYVPIKEILLFVI